MLIDAGTHVELGINPSHIVQKSLTVLNPLSRVDANIMDDADLAGPFVFCFAFAFVLLLVSQHPSAKRPQHPVDLPGPVWETPILLHLRRRSPRYNSNLPSPKSNVRNRNRRLSNRLSSRILPNPNGRSRWSRYGCWDRSSLRIPDEYNLHCLVYTFGEFDLRGGIEDGSSEVVGCVPGGIVIWVFCAVEYIQCEEVSLARHGIEWHRTALTQA